MPKHKPDDSWTPCSERLPPEGSKVILSVAKIEKTGVGEWEVYEREVIPSCTYRGGTRKAFVTEELDYEDRWGFEHYKKITTGYLVSASITVVPTAWMLMPEPYKPKQ